MQTIGDRIWYRIHAFVLEKIAERLNEVGFTGGYLDAGHVSGGASTTLSHSATGHTAATLGNILYAAAAGAWTLLAGNTTTTRKFLRQTGTGAVSAVPAWDTLVDGDIPTTLAGKTLTTATLTAPTIADFTNAQHDHGDADDGGAVVGGGGAPTTADYLVGTADAGLSAEIVVGATPGGELGGSWASPTVDAIHSGSSHASLVVVPGGSDTQVQFNDGGVFGGDAGFTYDKITGILLAQSLSLTNEFLVSDDPGNAEEELIEIKANEIALQAGLQVGVANSAPTLSFKPSYDPGSGPVLKFIDLVCEIDDVSGNMSFLFKMDISGGDFIFTEGGVFSGQTGSAFLGSSAMPWTQLFLSQYIETVEMTAPAAPAANGVRIYTQDNGAGKTQLMALFSSGAAQQIAIQP